MWPRLVNFFLGVSLYAAPDVLGYGGAAATSSRIAGPLAAGFAFVAIWETTRGLRWANVPTGAWLVVAPVFLPHEPAALATSVAVGLLVAVFAFLRGDVEGSYGGGWSALVRDERKAGEGRGERVTR